MAGQTLCILGTGNLGTAILSSLVNTSGDDKSANFSKINACVKSEGSEQRLKNRFSKQVKDGKIVLYRGENVKAVQESDIIILGVDPADVEHTLKQQDLVSALKGKLLLSIAAGWTRPQLEDIITSAGGSLNEKDGIWIIKALPNIAASVSESLTAVEDPHKDISPQYLDIAESIFEKIGTTVRVAPRVMEATTAVGGSTPAMWAIICDAFIDAAVAVGVPRASTQTMIYQSMKGTATLLQSGIHPGILRDQGTSPEGCTIAGVMVLEEAGVRGALGKALREAVTVARLMGKVDHVNDTRH